MDLSFIRYSYFNLLPSELILEIIYSVDNFKEVITFIKGNYRIKMIYFDHKNIIKRNFIVRKVPEISKVFDNEYSTHDSIHNDEVDYIISDVSRLINSSLDDVLSDYVDLEEYKKYNLAYRYLISKEYPNFYQKMKHLKFDKQLEKSNRILRQGRYEEVPDWLALYHFLKTLHKNYTDLQIYKYIVNEKLPMNYIVTENDFDLILLNVNLTYALVIDSNFNPEIQDNPSLLSILFYLFKINIDTYRDLVSKLSKNKKNELIPQISKDYQGLMIDEPDSGGWADSYNDYLIDLLERL